MKTKLIILSLLLTGCTTVYKVDDKGICRSPSGKIVKVKDVDPERIMKKIGYGGRIRTGTTPVPGTEWGNYGTAYGW
jgi:starvation-inducible outer membrane lipoprotein